LLYCVCGLIVGISKYHRYMNVEIGNEAAHRFIWGIFVSTFRDSAFAMQPPVEREYWLMYQGERRTTPATLLYSLSVNGKLRKPW
jgi:hypothetical protein